MAKVNVVLTARLHKSERVRDRLRFSANRIYPIARAAVAKHLGSVLEKIKEETPVGEHLSDPEGHPYPSARFQYPAHLRKHIVTVPMTRGPSLGRIEVEDDVDKWGISAQTKASWLISGIRRTWPIAPVNETILEFWWKNPPAQVIERQLKRKTKRKVKRPVGRPKATHVGKFYLVRFKRVTHPRFKVNKFHERGWDAAKDEFVRRLSNELKGKIIVSLK